MTEIEIKAKIYDILVIMENAKAEMNSLQIKLQEIQAESAES